MTVDPEGLEDQLAALVLQRAHLENSMNRLYVDIRLKRHIEDVELLNDQYNASLSLELALKRRADALEIILEGILEPSD